MTTNNRRLQAGVTAVALATAALGCSRQSSQETPSPARKVAEPSISSLRVDDRSIPLAPNLGETRVTDLLAPDDASKRRLTGKNASGQFVDLNLSAYPELTVQLEAQATAHSVIFRRIRKGPVLWRLMGPVNLVAQLQQEPEQKQEVGPALTVLTPDDKVSLTSDEFYGLRDKHPRGGVSLADIAGKLFPGAKLATLTNAEGETLEAKKASFDDVFLNINQRGTYRVKVKASDNRGLREVTQLVFK